MNNFCLLSFSFFSISKHLLGYISDFQHLFVFQNSSPVRSINVDESEEVPLLRESLPDNVATITRRVRPDRESPSQADALSNWCTFMKLSCFANVVLLHYRV